jgi:hypothetical protein
MSHQRIVTSAAFKDKPWWFRTTNQIWKSTYPLSTKINLDKDVLIRKARKQTGLQSFGSDFWEEPLDRLLYAIDHEANLHPVGRFITQQRMINLLSVRLRAEDAFRKNPHILEQELYPVMLICGLQRTGTTKLQRLLAADPDNRVLYSWEALNPVPLSEGPEDIKLRKKAARLGEKALKLMAPGFFTIHPVEFEKPEEDILLLDTTFMSTTPEATMHVPSYAAWLEQTDQSPAYAYAVKLLKYLQLQRPAKRWVLKTPHHMEFLDLAHKHFGDVQYLWTHRDIQQSLPSFLSMLAHGQTIFSDSVDLERIAAHWVRKTSYMLSKGEQFRAQYPGAHITDISFEQLVSAPMEVLQEIYSHHPIADTLRQSFMQMEKTNDRYKFGRHVYRMEDFNVDRDALEQLVRLQQRIEHNDK